MGNYIGKYELWGLLRGILGVKTMAQEKLHVPGCPATCKGLPGNEGIQYIAVM